MEIGMVRKVDIDHEMQQSYLDYAMSVIVARALPDARDGLKPVQRRLLYAMYDMGIRPDSPYKKSARIVGEVLGKYHPHGDQAVYESMARMAQDFSMRYTLIDGQGNFGSVDGDPPAAMRYTEARITPFAMDMLSQLDRNTIDFDRNFDDTLDEPSVLPAALPNLLVNGASGIAVGMATSIPPHNLGEVTDALIYLVEHWDQSDDVTIADLMKFIQGPDFPTGGIILQEHDQNEIQSAYATGKGKIMLRGRVSIEEAARGKSRIIVSELPYMTNKAALIERIAELSREGQLDAVTDLRDESDRHGMRIVIELKQGAEPEKTLLALYKKTPMQVTFTINLLALVNGEPRLMTLKQALKVFVEHRLEVITRRSQFDLQKAQERLHLLEGLRIALKFLDEVIATIRAARDTDEARIKLVKKFKLSEIQAQAILDMPLKRLAALERKKIEDEYKQVAITIKDLQALLKSKKRLQQEVILELQETRQKYVDRRRTQIVSLKSGKSTSELLTVNDVIPVETVWVGMTQDGRLGLMRGETPPRLGGMDAPLHLLQSDSHQTLYLVNGEGKAASIAVSSIPETEKFSNGILYNKVCALTEEKLPVSLFSIPPEMKNDPAMVVMTLSRDGLIKKSLVSELPGVSSQVFTLAKVNQDDVLVSAILSQDKSDLLVLTRQGMGIRFKGEEVRAMNLVAAGVNAIKLNQQDAALTVIELKGNGELLLLDRQGTGWRMGEEDFPVQGRYGQGVIACRLKSDNWLAGAIYGRKTQEGIVFLKKGSARSLRLDVIPLTKRGAAGKKAIEVKTGDEVEDFVMPSVGTLAMPSGEGGKSRGRRKSVATKAKPASSKEAEEPANRTSGAKSIGRTTSRKTSSAESKSRENAAKLPAKAQKSETATRATKGELKKSKEAEGPTTLKISTKAASKPASPSAKRSEKVKSTEKLKGKADGAKKKPSPAKTHTKKAPSVKTKKSTK